jgi:hypothetical protein
MLIGNGKFQFTPANEKPIEGYFRAAMLRFNPNVQPALIALDKGKTLRDLGATEMAQHMLRTVLRHCYQSSKEGGRRIEVLIPPKGALAAVLYSKEHGDLLVSIHEKGAVAHNFTSNESIYEQK